MAPEPLVAFAFGQDVAQLGHHLLGEQPGGIHALVGRHVAHVHQAEDVADVQALDQLFHPLADGFRRTGDDVAAVDEVLPGQLAEAACGGAYCDSAPVWMVLMVR